MATKYYTWLTMVQDSVLESEFLLRKLQTSWAPSSNTGLCFLEPQIIARNLITFKDMVHFVVCTSAAENPWSNRLNELYYGILGGMVKKITEDTNCSFEVTFIWAISAKNTLHSVQVYSTNQLSLAGIPICLFF